MGSPILVIQFTELQYLTVHFKRKTSNLKFSDIFVQAVLRINIPLDTFAKCALVAGTVWDPALLDSPHHFILTIKLGAGPQVSRSLL